MMRTLQTLSGQSRPNTGRRGQLRSILTLLGQGAARGGCFSCPEPRITGAASTLCLRRLCCPTKAEYTCADHSVTFIFRLRQSGGPYMPVSPYPRNSYQRLIPFNGRDGEHQPEPRIAQQPGSGPRDFYHRL